MSSVIYRAWATARLRDLARGKYDAMERNYKIAERYIKGSRNYYRHADIGDAAYAAALALEMAADDIDSM